jgi:site-specific DNA recombinase
MTRKADRSVLRCAIYTRKSTEEGLEQAFNSLDAQREACAAYIMSQTHEGWERVPEPYDDGGYSGGKMDRPGLTQLLEDVRAGKVDVIVVYKVDRLTRSLADFAKIVEVLDKHNASFVSVTQAFNTTTSMGRLTLNVLLSFAQFEREVTGERIRDKIAASKARGMWMGGVVPLGYKVEDRKLIIVPEEAERVRHIFQRYLELGSVLALEAELTSQGLRSRIRVGRTGKQYGGTAFSRGALYLMLKNRIYLGEICHKGTAYPGEHMAIVDQALFDRVAQLLERNCVDHANAVRADQPSLLCGLVQDSLGRCMTPSHANKKGARYRYYVSRIDHKLPRQKAWRVPAGELEALIINCLRRQGREISIPSRKAMACLISQVIVHNDRIEIVPSPSEHGSQMTIAVPASLVRRGKEMRLAVTSHDMLAPRPDPSLIKLIVNAHRCRSALFNSGSRSIQEAADTLGYRRDYFAVLLRLAFLAPDITAAILDGRQPIRLNRQRLARISGLPIDWQTQRDLLGFA